MRKMLYVIGLLLVLAACQSTKKSNSPISLKWEMGSNGEKNKTYPSTFTLYNHSDSVLGSNWAIYYNQLPRTVSQDSTAPIKVERINGDFFKITPTAHYKALQPNDSIVFTFAASGAVIKESHAPVGGYIVFTTNGKEQTPVNVPIQVVPFTNESQWSRPNAAEAPYPSGELVYQQTSEIDSAKIDQFDLLPSLKSVNKKAGTCSVPREIVIKAAPEFENESTLLIEKFEKTYDGKIDSKAEFVVYLEQLPKSVKPVNDEFYRIEILSDCVKIQANTTHGMFNGTQTFLSLLKGATFPVVLPNSEITDYPDLPYRGQMIDISRNFLAKDKLMKLIDVFASYKLNVLHLHATDDEGWRIEIPGLEELTTVGAHRGHTTDEANCLYPSYGSGFSSTDVSSPGNGFYTKADFIEILQYATRRHVRVITELDFPGHARAAIVAMKARYKKYIDTDPAKANAYLLNDFDDKSVYKSAQDYTDNVICVAKPAVYNFMDKVTSELVAMYKEAGAPISEIHIGGDEVPRGAWEGSPICKEFMQKEKMTRPGELRTYFLKQMNSIFAKHNVKMAGWQEVALTDDHKLNTNVFGNISAAYCWNTVPESGDDVIPYQLANGGCNVILSNVNNLYFDLAYSKHPAEPGLHWAGFVNEISSFNMQPYNIYRSARTDMKGTKVVMARAGEGKESLKADAVSRIRGIQGQMWSENIPSIARAEYALFPKMFGLIERGWNARPQWSTIKDVDQEQKAYSEALSQYYSKISEKELPSLARNGVNFRVNQPGLIIENGVLLANNLISEAKIRYTLDGTEPTVNSTEWSKPVQVRTDMKEIKAKAFYLDKESCTSILKIK